MSALSDLLAEWNDGGWRLRARCRSAPSSIFFPSQGEDLEQARAICRACPVQSPCRAYALRSSDLQGIWAGLSESDRHALRAEEIGAPEAAPVPVPEPHRAADEASTPERSAAARGALFGVLEQLSSYPDRWARVARFSSPRSAASVASQLRLGRRPVPPGLWQFAIDRNDEGGSDLYARYDSALVEGGRLAGEGPTNRGS